MVNANIKGRAAENQLATYLRVNGYEAELLRLAGEVDRGDLWVPQTAHRVEVKSHAKITDVLNLGVLDVRKLNANFPHDTNVLVVRRPGQPTKNWYVVREVQDVWPMLEGSMLADDRKVGG